MTYKAKPDYERCVGLVTKAALREMQFPGLVCVVTPIIVGLVFRFVGESSNRALLGAEVLASYLMFGTVTGILMALFLDTSGGAWDNAKKYIELGNFGGKNSEAHKAAVTGDTVGDPFVSLFALHSSMKFGWFAHNRFTSIFALPIRFPNYHRKIQLGRHFTSLSSCYLPQSLLLDLCLSRKYISHSDTNNTATSRYRVAFCHRYLNSSFAILFCLQWFDIRIKPIRYSQ